jgi:hypothetical protein
MEIRNVVAVNALRSDPNAWTFAVPKRVESALITQFAFGLVDAVEPHVVTL